MKPVNPLRKIAEDVLVSRFRDLDADIRNELAISLVRQWLTNDGHAGFVTATYQHWFRLVTKESGDIEVGLCVWEGNWGRVLSQHWHVDEDSIPDFLHRLNLCQSARCRNVDGQTIWLRIEPKERVVKCQEQEEAMDP